MIFTGCGGDEEILEMFGIPGCMLPQVKAEQLCLWLYRQECDGRRDPHRGGLRVTSSPHCSDSAVLKPETLKARMERAASADEYGRTGGTVKVGAIDNRGGKRGRYGAVCTGGKRVCCGGRDSVAAG